MKKTFTVIAALAAFAATSKAQSLGSLVSSLAGSSNVAGTISNVIYAYTGNTTAVSLPGSWTYTGPAISLESDNALSKIAGTAASASAESKVSGYLEKVGIRSGAVAFTFNEDLSFSCTIKNIPLSGTWRTIDDGSKVQLQFGQNMKYLSMTGTLEGTAGGCKMLFNGKKFLDFVKKAMTYVGKADSTVGAISSLAGNYDSIKIGFNLSKKK